MPYTYAQIQQSNTNICTSLPIVRKCQSKQSKNLPVETETPYPPNFCTCPASYLLVTCLIPSYPAVKSTITTNDTKSENGPVTRHCGKTMHRFLVDQVKSIYHHNTASQFDIPSTLIIRVYGCIDEGWGWLLTFISHCPISISPCPPCPPCPGMGMGMSMLEWCIWWWSMSFSDNVPSQIKSSDIAVYR